MKTILKNWWLIALVTGVIGLVLIGVGWGLGASGGYIYIDRDGLHTANLKDENMEINEHDLEKLTEIDISAASSNVEFVRSDHYGLEISLPGHKDDINWQVENGKLTVAQDFWSDFNIFTFNLGFLKSNFVKVYYPEDAHFSNLKLETSSGNIKMPSAVSVENLIAKSASGNIRASVKNCSQADLKVTSGNIELFGNDTKSALVHAKSTSGSIDIVDMVWSDLSAETVSGSIEVSGDAKGSSYIKSTSGNASLKLKGRASDYSYELTSTSGSIRINDERVGSPARSSAGASTLSMKTTSGRIRLYFEQ